MRSQRGNIGGQRFLVQAAELRQRFLGHHDGVGGEQIAHQRQALLGGGAGEGENGGILQGHFRLRARFRCDGMHAQSADEAHQQLGKLRVVRAQRAAQQGGHGFRVHGDGGLGFQGQGFLRHRARAGQRQGQRQQQG